MDSALLAAQIVAEAAEKNLVFSKLHFSAKSNTSKGHSTIVINKKAKGFCLVLLKEHQNNPLLDYFIF